MFAQASNFEIKNSTFQSGHVINNNFLNNASERGIAPSGYQEGMSDINTQPCPPEFIGRKEIISLLEIHFIKTISSMNQHKQKRYLLWGLGGAGKTQTALEFAFQFENQFTNIWLIHATSQSLIHASFFDIAKQRDFPQPSWLSGKRWLETHKEEWLVIFDNADDPEINLGKFLPSCRHGNVIITSRNAALVQLTVGSSGGNLEVQNMNHADAVQLFLSNAGMKHNSNSEEQRMAEKIAQTLQFFPLALVQAGAYIQQQQCLLGYLDRYKSQRAQIMSLDMSQSYDDYTLSVYSTWDLSWKKLPTPAQEFLRICSCMHFENIPREVFQRAVQHLEKVNQDHPGLMVNQVIGILQRLFSKSDQWDNMKMDHIISELKSFSMITVSKDGKEFNMHPLVHQWIFDKIPERRDEITAFLAVSMQKISKSEMRFVYQLQAHCKFAKPLCCNEMFIWKAFRKLWILGGDHQEALPVAQALVQMSEQRLGKLHIDTLIQTEILGVVFRQLGKYNDALELQEHLVRASEGFMGKEHSSTLTQTENLAITYWVMGRYQEALQLQESLLEVTEKLLGEQHPVILDRIQNLANTYAHLGRYSDALELQEPLLRSSQDILGKGHPDTLTRIQNLASTYKDLGNLYVALDLEEALLRLSYEILGKHHLETLKRTQNLAITYNHLGRHSDALALEIPLLKLSLELLGKEHPDTLTRTQNLAVTYWAMGRHQEALFLQDPLLKVTERVLGRQHPDSLNQTQNLANTYNDLGRFHEALELQKPLLKLSQEILGKHHPDVLTQMQNLARTYQSLGRTNDALELEKDLLRLSENILGKQHPNTLDRMQNLVVTYARLECFSDALELAGSLQELSENILGKQHPHTLSRTQNLAITYCVMGRYCKAIRIQEDLLELSEEILGKQHSDTLYRMENLAMMYKDTGRADDAFELQGSYLRLSEESLSKQP